MRWLSAVVRPKAVAATSEEPMASIIGMAVCLQATATPVPTTTCCAKAVILGTGTKVADGSTCAVPALGVKRPRSARTRSFECLA